MLTSLVGDKCPICEFRRKNIVFDDMGHIQSVRCSICDTPLDITEKEINIVRRYVRTRDFNEYP